MIIMTRSLVRAMALLSSSTVLADPLKVHGPSRVVDVIVAGTTVR